MVAWLAIKLEAMIKQQLQFTFDIQGWMKKVQSLAADTGSRT